jgi:DNA-binding NarL/FixJ family response regulator
MINILIADDHPLVRAGLKQIIAETADLAITDEAANGLEVLEKVRKSHFSLVLLDITMPGLSGLDVLKQLRSEMPDLPVLVLSIHSEEHYAIRVLKAGASGYLTKESAPEELIAAIRKVSEGGKYVSPSLAEKFASDLGRGSDQPLHEGLSDREYQVLRMVARGDRLKEISEELGLSVKTISTYRSRVLQKMKMKSNAELTSYAIRYNLID